MIHLDGKFNHAKVFLPNDKVVIDDVEEYYYLDRTTKEQILGFLNHPAFKGDQICVMPDTHAGKGAVIGFTFRMGDYVVPNVVGVDIGCGVSSINIGPREKYKLDFSDVDKLIRAAVPIGFSVHTDNMYKEIVKKDPDLMENISEVVELLGNREKYSLFVRSLGTLGGGNHFIELGVDEENNLWVTVHSGSRNFGLTIANHFQKKARRLNDAYLSPYPSDLAFLPLSEQVGQDYMRCMNIAQWYTDANRCQMLENLVACFDEKMSKDLTYMADNSIHSVHNYIATDGMIRKGAIRAYKNERVIIPFNMEDGLIIGRGKGNPEWNMSAPHGAGRILSRTAAKKVLSLEDATKSMKDAGIFTTSLNLDTLDEAKGAYKDKLLILDMIAPTVDVEKFVKPIYNLKAGGD